MNFSQNFPTIANVTDLRYRWNELIKDLEKTQTPILVMQHSTPKAVIYPFNKVKKLIKRKSVISDEDSFSLINRLAGSVEVPKRFKKLSTDKIIEKAKKEYFKKK